MVGVSVILESAAIWVGFFYLRRQSKIRMILPVLWGFGVLVHVIMLVFMLALPNRIGFTVLEQIGIPVLTLYPVASVLVCLLFLDSEKQIRDRKTLFESEKALKKAQQIAHLGNWALDLKQNRLDLSDEMYQILGIDKEFINGNLFDVIKNAIHPNDNIAYEQAKKSVIENNILKPMEFHIF